MFPKREACQSGHLHGVSTYSCIFESALWAVVAARVIPADITPGREGDEKLLSIGRDAIACKKSRGHRGVVLPQKSLEPSGVVCIDQGYWVLRDIDGWCMRGETTVLVSHSQASDLDNHIGKHMLLFASAPIHVLSPETSACVRNHEAGGIPGWGIWFRLPTGLVTVLDGASNTQPEYIDSKLSLGRVLRIP